MLNDGTLENIPLQSVGRVLRKPAEVPAVLRTNEGFRHSGEGGFVQTTVTSSEKIS